MDEFFENEYFGAGRLLMIWIGLWPYEKSHRKSGLRLFHGIVFLASILCSMAKLLTSRPNLDVYVESSMPLVICCLCYTKYITWWMKGEELKGFLEQIKLDWCAIRIQQEMDTVKRYARDAKLFGLFYMLCLYSGISIFALVTFAPFILDLIKPLNETRPRRHPFEAEYFVDPEKYFYPILAHMLLTAVIAHTVAGATDWIFIFFVLHACALFRILGCRMERIFDEAVTASEKSRDVDAENRKFCSRIRYCVQLHRHCLKFVKRLNNVYVYSYLTQLIFAVLTLTILLLRLYERITPIEDPFEAVVCAVHAGGLIFIIFLNIYPTQLLMNVSEEVFYQAYYGPWYAASVKPQKLLLIFMRKSMDPAVMTAANLITSSVQVFAAIVQTSLSYFTVLYTMKN